jgi:hypothetical protein
MEYTGRCQIDFNVQGHPHRHGVGPHVHALPPSHAPSHGRHCHFGSNDSNGSKITAFESM